MCDASCGASIVVHDCVVNFIGDLEDVPDLAMEAINGKLTFRRLQVVTGNIELREKVSTLALIRPPRRR